MEINNIDSYVADYEEIHNDSVSKDIVVFRSASGTKFQTLACRIPSGDIIHCHLDNGCVGFYDGVVMTRLAEGVLGFGNYAKYKKSSIRLPGSMLMESNVVYELPFHCGSGGSVIRLLGVNQLNAGLLLGKGGQTKLGLTPKLDRTLREEDDKLFRKILANEYFEDFGMSPEQDDFGRSDFY